MQSSHKYSVIIGLACLTMILGACAPQGPGRNGGDTPNDHGGRRGNGSMMRGDRSGSGMMSRISPEDQTLLKSLMDARRSGDTETVTRIEAELQAKYPEMHFGSGMSGSGFMRRNPQNENSGSIMPRGMPGTGGVISGSGSL